jgi:hypothetical protein
VLLLIRLMSGSTKQGIIPGEEVKKLNLLDKDDCMKRHLHFSKMFRASMPSDKSFCYYCMTEYKERGGERVGFSKDAK